LVQSSDLDYGKIIVLKKYSSSFRRDLLFGQKYIRAQLEIGKCSNSGNVGAILGSEKHLVYLISDLKRRLQKMTSFRLLSLDDSLNAVGRKGSHLGKEPPFIYVGLVISSIRLLGQ
jgi:hypothetical protein